LTPNLYKKTLSHFIEAFTNLAATKLRTVLAMLGILVGTASVVAMVSTGELATQAALEQFKSLGTDMLAVSVFSETASTDSSSSNDFDLSAALGLQTVSSAITTLAPYTMLYVPMSYLGNSIDGTIIGATQNLAPAIKIDMVQGRFISDLDNYSEYCVVGDTIAQKIQPYASKIIGTQIKLGNDFFTIIGVAKNWPENQFFSQDINNSVIVPIKASKLISKYANIDNIVMRLDPNANIETIKTNITQYMSAKVPNKKLYFRSAKELIKSMAAQHKIFTILLGLIGSISLLVGGIGVMNIMLVSVLERRREIGIRLALGAKRHDIQWMFLSEAIVLALSGGIIGIIIGIMCAFIIAEFAHWHFTVFLWPPLVGFTVSALVGIFFGFYPARQAARLDPIETLRTE